MFFSLLESSKANQDEAKPKMTTEEYHLLLSIIAKMEEQLWALTQNCNHFSTFADLWRNNNSARSHTAYGRLASYLTWPTELPSPLKMAECGLVNIYDHATKVRHFLGSNYIVEDILELSEKPKSELESYLRGSFGENNRMLQGLPSLNVPLDATLSYLPASLHRDLKENPVIIKDVVVPKHGNFVLTGSEDGSVTIWNVLLKPYTTGKTHFFNPLDSKVLKGKEKRKRVRKPKTEESNKSPEKKSKVEEVNEDEDLFIRMFKEDDTYYADASEIKREEDEFEESDDDEDEMLVEHLLKELNPEERKKEVDQNKIDELLLSHYPIELIIEALQRAPEQKLKFAKKLLNKITAVLDQTKVAKPVREWLCATCCYVNPQHRTRCQNCAALPPNYAFYNSFDFRTILKSKNEELGKVLAENEFYNDQKNCDIHGYTFSNNLGNPMDPFTIGCLITHRANKKSFFKLRKMKLKESIQKQFLRTESEDIGTYCGVCNIWFSPHDSQQRILSHISIEHKTIFEALFPLFVSGQQTEGKPFEISSNLSAQELYIACEEFVLPLPFTQILSTVSQENNISAENIWLLGEDAEGKANICNVNIHETEEGALQAKILTTKTLENKINGPTKLLYTNKNLVMVTERDITVFSSQDLQQVSSEQNNGWSVKSAQLINKFEPHLYTKDTDYKEYWQYQGRTHPLGNRAADLTESNILVLSGKNSVAEFIIGQNLSSLPKQVVVTPQIDFNELELKDIRFLGVCLESDVGIMSKANEADGFILQSTFTERDIAQSKRHCWTKKRGTENLPHSKFETVFDIPHKVNEVHARLSFKSKNTLAELRVHKEKTKEDLISTKVVEKRIKLPHEILSLYNIYENGVETNKPQYLPLFLFSHKGAQPNEKIHQSRMLVDDDTSFSTNYPMADFTFHHQHGKRMIITSVSFCL